MDKCRILIPISADGEVYHLAKRKRNKALAWLTAAVVLLVLAGTGLWAWRDGAWRLAQSDLPPLPLIESEDAFNERYDVIVAGTDPEGVAAALSSARHGLDVLLVDGKGRDRLGGLITLGWLNSWDLNFAPIPSPSSGEREFLNKGIFQEWYDQLGGTSFDVVEAAAALHRMVAAEPRIHILMDVQSMKPIMEGSDVAGIVIVDEEGVERSIGASAVIDATQDGDIAALAGVPYTVGREDLGYPEARMAVTLVFKLKGVTDEIWKSFGEREDTGIDKKSAWGFLDARLYESTDPERVAMRGLNIGRQNDDSVLINAMHLFGIDPLDPKSVEEGFRIGREEAPRIVEFLKDRFQELSELEYAGTAPELYFRESRHIQGEYRLMMADVMENRDFWDAVAYGSYDVDIQRLGQEDSGAIMMSPLQYGVPFRTLVPLTVNRLLVVGRAASFDSLPHGSARVVPLGMATGEAAGAAAKLALSQGMSFRELSYSRKAIAELRTMLTNAGMDLTYLRMPKPDYMKHRAYKGLVAAVSMNMTIGGYDNSRWNLDGHVTPESFHNMMKRWRRKHPAYFKGNPIKAAPKKAGQETLSLDEVAYGVCVMAGLDTTPEKALSQLLKRGWVTSQVVNDIENRRMMTNGDTFMLIRDMTEYYTGTVYE